MTINKSLFSSLPQFPTLRLGSCLHEPFISSLHFGSCPHKPITHIPWFVFSRTIYFFSTLWFVSSQTNYPHHLVRVFTNQLPISHGSCLHEPFTYSTLTLVHVFTNQLFTPYALVRVFTTPWFVSSRTNYPFPWFVSPRTN